MKNQGVLTALIILTLISYPAKRVIAQDQCSDILKNGIFNTVTINQSEGVKNDYNAWLCTTEFSTHIEASNAGVSIGFPVYGVPVELGGKFDSKARNEWKKAHCSSITDKSQYSATYQKLVSEVSEIIVTSWRDCMIASYDQRVGLSSIAQSRGPKQIVMKIRWRSYDNFDTRLPKVVGYSMVGAKQVTVGSTLFKIGKKVPATETNVDFIRENPTDSATLTLNTDRGSITAYVPPQKMSLTVRAIFSPTIEIRRIDTKSYEFYKHTPDNDCVADLNFDQVYYPPDGYDFTSYSFAETTKAGKRTSYRSQQQGNGVHFWMHVQGDDGALGYCESHGWLGLRINVTGQKWNRVPMTAWDSGDVKGALLQESVLIHYPYLQPSPDARNFQLSFVATVKKIIGDDIAIVQLTDGIPSAGGVEAKTDTSGNLVIDATKAFADWKNSIGGPVRVYSEIGKAAQPANPLLLQRARQACESLGSEYEVYRVTRTETFGVYQVMCGISPASVASGSEPKRVAIASFNINK